MADFTPNSSHFVNGGGFLEHVPKSRGLLTPRPAAAGTRFIRVLICSLKPEWRSQVYCRGFYTVIRNSETAVWTSDLLFHGTAHYCKVLSCVIYQELNFHSPQVTNYKHRMIIMITF